MQNAGMSQLDLSVHQHLYVHQVREVAELFGFETRNKYQISAGEGVQKIPVAYAAEQGKGVLGFLFRQYLGHWRKFDIHIMNTSRETILIAHHPFRWIFERVEVRDAQGRQLGAIQKRFSIFTKRFDVQNEYGKVIMEVASPLLKFWTFGFMQQGQEVASVKKKWSGLFNEAFTDKDVFQISYQPGRLNSNERLLVMTSSIFIDLLYFEHKAR